MIPEYFDDEDAETEYYYDNQEEALENCGITQTAEGVNCYEIGTEYCSFMCPFHAALRGESDATT